MLIYYNACHIYFYDRTLIYSVQTARYSPYLYSGYCCDVEKNAVVLPLDNALVEMTRAALSFSINVHIC